MIASTNIPLAFQGVVSVGFEFTNPLACNNTIILYMYMNTVNIRNCVSQPELMLFANPKCTKTSLPRSMDTHFSWDATVVGQGLNVHATT